MKNMHEPGLGELLRHLTDLVDGGARDAYTRNGLTGVVTLLAGVRRRATVEGGNDYASYLLQTAPFPA